MTNSVPPITTGSISTMTGLTKRPIYFLTIAPAIQPNVVVKGEMLSQSMSENDVLVSIKWSSKLMKNVNNQQVNSKIMTNNEVLVFKSKARAVFPQGSAQEANLQNAGYRWVKMPMVHGLSDAETYDDNSNPLMKAVKANTQRFLRVPLWRELGQVLAVDIFNGNNDRFVLSSGHWQNQGNVMFAGDGSVIGLDTFDPYAGDQANLGSQGGFDEMRILIDANLRIAFATKCVESVGKELQKTARNAGMGRWTVSDPANFRTVTFDTESLATLFLPYAQTLADGIATGAQTLRQYLVGKAAQNVAPTRPTTPAPRNAGGLVMGRKAPAPVKGLPQGIKDRMQYLGW